VCVSTSMKKIGKAEKRLGIDLVTDERIDFLADYYNVNKKVVMHYAIEDMYEYTEDQDQRYSID